MHAVLRHGFNAVQNNTSLKLRYKKNLKEMSFNAVQNNTSLKLLHS